MPRWSVLASDYDGTLATAGRVPAEARDALARLREQGGTFVLVTGRRVPELYDVFPDAHACTDLVVAENGGLLLDPRDGSEALLAPRPPEELKSALVEAGVVDVELGETLVSTWREQEDALRQVAERLFPAWPCQVVPNKDRVMLVPAGVDKGSGLAAAAQHLGVDLGQVVAIGDGENDVELLRAAGLGVAVADAVPSLRSHADVVTRGDASAGVVEAIDTVMLAGADLG